MSQFMFTIARRLAYKVHQFMASPPPPPPSFIQLSVCLSLIDSFSLLSNVTLVYIGPREQDVLPTWPRARDPTKNPNFRDPLKAVHIVHFLYISTTSNKQPFIKTNKKNESKKVREKIFQLRKSQRRSCQERKTIQKHLLSFVLVKQFLCLLFLYLIVRQCLLFYNSMLPPPFASSPLLILSSFSSSLFPVSALVFTLCA